MDSPLASFVVFSLTEWNGLLGAKSLKDKSSMHLYARLLCGIIATGEIFNLVGTAFYLYLPI